LYIENVEVSLRRKTPESLQEGGFYGPEEEELKGREIVILPASVMDFRQPLGGL